MLLMVGNKHGIHEAFVDFLKLSAIAVSNRCDLAFYKEREQRYLDIVRKYSTVEMDHYSEMLALLCKALQAEAGTERLKDVLGEVYHELGLHNKWKGQVFTPQNICDLLINPEFLINRRCLHGYKYGHELLGILQPGFNDATKCGTIIFCEIAPGCSWYFA